MKFPNKKKRKNKKKIINPQFLILSVLLQVKINKFIKLALCLLILCFNGIFYSIKKAKIKSSLNSELFNRWSVFI